MSVFITIVAKKLKGKKDTQNFVNIPLEVRLNTKLQAGNYQKIEGISPSLVAFKRVCLKCAVRELVERGLSHSNVRIPALLGRGGCQKIVLFMLLDGLERANNYNYTGNNTLIYLIINYNNPIKCKGPRPLINSINKAKNPNIANLPFHISAVIVIPHSHLS